jgi:hypothetical protein
MDFKDPARVFALDGIDAMRDIKVIFNFYSGT